MLDVKELEASVEDQSVLKGLSLSIKPGEVHAVMGPNGSGKTTLLKVLSTQARPDEGEVWVGGIDRSCNAQALRRIIGVVPHRSLLYDDMTCHENLVFYGRMYGLRDPDVRAEEALAVMGLGGRSRHKLGALSNGMQKRLSIARAILHKPQILLLDEPESGLDQEALEMLEALLAGWQQEGGTVLMTTHNLEQGLAWSGMVAILSGGKIAFQESRRTLDVAGFRGTYRQYLEAAS